MTTPVSLPQGCEWLTYPHRFRFVGNSGQLCECALSAAVKRQGDKQAIYVLCSELKDNWGTTVTNSWGPAISLEMQVRTHILADAGEKLGQSSTGTVTGWHYEVSAEDLEGWHFFEHHKPHPGERDSCIYPVAIPYEDQDTLLGPSIDLSSEDPGALLASMAQEVANRGFAIKEVPW